MRRLLPFEWRTLDVRVRQVLPTLLVVAVGLAAFDYAFRRWHPFNFYGGWGSPALENKIKGAHKVFDRHKRMDVLTMSTSVGRPIDVRQWEEACAGKIDCYNFGFPDQRPERHRFLFEEYFWPKFHPSHLMYGIAPQDVNSASRGMHPDHPQTGEFWQYAAVKRLAAHTRLHELRMHLEDFSALFQARRHVRTTIQHGGIAELEAERTIGHGVNIPPSRRISFGPQELVWSRWPGLEMYNAYRDFWLPENGEFGELLKLSKFCREKGVKFTVVEIPTSPYAHTQFNNPADDYSTFTRMLDWLRLKGVEVIPMARDLPLDNTFFEDTEHVNRWGAQLMTNYVYEHLITRWFPDKVLAPVLPQPSAIELWKFAHASPKGLHIEKRYGITKDAQYAGEKQVVVTAAGAQLPFASVDAGSYSFELYAGDGTTTSPEQTGEARLQLRIEEQGRRAPQNILLNTWANARLGISYTQYHFTVASTATLTLEVDHIGKHPCIMDTVFLRRKLSNTGDGFTID